MSDNSEFLRTVAAQRQAQGIMPAAKPRRAVSSPKAPTSRPSPSGAPTRTDDIEARARAERRFALWKAAGFPPRHRERADAREEQGPAWLKARARTLEVVLDGGIVALVGPRGTGKTQLAASVCRELASVHGWSSQYHRTADLLGKFKHRVFGEGQDEFTFMARLARVRCMVLDEFQDRYETKTEDSILTRLIDHRYGAKVATIIVANLKPDQLAEALGPSATDRMRERGQIIACSWKSYRGASNA